MPSWIKCKTAARAGSWSAASSACLLSSPACSSASVAGAACFSAAPRGIGLRTTKDLLQRGGEVRTSPFDDFESRGVTELEPTLIVEIAYSELMTGRRRDPVYRGFPRARHLFDNAHVKSSDEIELD